MTANCDHWIVRNSEYPDSESSESICNLKREKERSLDAVQRNYELELLLIQQVFCTMEELTSENIFNDFEYKKTQNIGIVHRATF